MKPSWEGLIATYVAPTRAVSQGDPETIVTTAQTEQRARGRAAVLEGLLQAQADRALPRRCLRIVAIAVLVDHDAVLIDDRWRSGSYRYDVHQRAVDDRLQLVENAVGRHVGNVRPLIHAGQAIDVLVLDGCGDLVDQV